MVAKTYKKGHGRRRPLRDRVEEKLDKTGACWLWTGAIDAGGYGRIGVGGSRTAVAHRVAFELWVGPIPDGLHIDHLCSVRACCNPDHLEAVTQAENNRRAAAANRATVCKRGHEFTPENTVLTHGFRNCRTCRNAGVRERRAARKQVAA